MPFLIQRVKDIPNVLHMMSSDGGMIWNARQWLAKMHEASKPIWHEDVRCVLRSFFRDVTWDNLKTMCGKGFVVFSECCKTMRSFDEPLSLASVSALCLKLEGAEALKVRFTKAVESQFFVHHEREKHLKQHRDACAQSERAKNRLDARKRNEDALCAKCHGLQNRVKDAAAKVEATKARELHCQKEHEALSSGVDRRESESYKAKKNEIEQELHKARRALRECEGKLGHNERELESLRDLWNEWEMKKSALESAAAKFGRLSARYVKAQKEKEDSEKKSVDSSDDPAGAGDLCVHSPVGLRSRKNAKSRDDQVRGGTSRRLPMIPKKKAGKDAAVGRPRGRKVVR